MNWHGAAAMVNEVALDWPQNRRRCSGGHMRYLDVRFFDLNSVFRSSVLAALGIMIGSAGSHAAKLDDFAGYWTGGGKVTLNNGSTEQVKCVVTYKTTGDQLRQNIRCASQGFSFNGTSELQITGNKVTGKWIENTYSATGDVTGKFNDAGFALSISGMTFTATMDVATVGCKQTLDITPKGLEVVKIALGLGKC
jgi:hypothetical protein